MRLLNDACALMTHQWEKTQGWQSMLVPEISRRLGGGSKPADDLRAQALAASAIACLNAATDASTTDGGTTPLSVLVDQAMGTLSELNAPC
ncbi:hypothetical protein [Streptomyces sp. NPDC014995]|uniref:acyl-CoA-like ligand-binding transcription factor n=1 Tax=Streptomyces sp. NPDC014995 TaxID=3364936 RepID=UPI0036FB02E5